MTDNLCTTPYKAVTNHIAELTHHPWATVSSAGDAQLLRQPLVWSTSLHSGKDYAPTQIQVHPLNQGSILAPDLHTHTHTHTHTQHTAHSTHTHTAPTRGHVPTSRHSNDPRQRDVGHHGRGGTPPSSPHLRSPREGGHHHRHTSRGRRTRPPDRHPPIGSSHCTRLSPRLVTFADLSRKFIQKLVQHSSSRAVLDQF
jgi:hypothetical protein